MGAALLIINIALTYWQTVPWYDYAWKDELFIVLLLTIEKDSIKICMGHDRAKFFSLGRNKNILNKQDVINIKTLSYT